MIYLDYQATTPLAPEARAAMLPWLGDQFGNPHSAHKAGRAAAAAVEHARNQVLSALALPPGRLVFTSGATEAVSWAIQSAMRAAAPSRPAIVTIATEHACVLDTARAMVAEGCELRVLPVDGEGIVDLDAARRAIREDVALVVAMKVNNEIGVIQPCEELAALAHAAGALFLCDAAQGFGRFSLPDESDLVAISAHKVHGPGGIGALWLREGVTLSPLLYGGGQQDGLRPGSLPPAPCVGFGAAASHLDDWWENDRLHVETLWRRATEALDPEWRINGSIARRYSGNLNIRREGVDAARLISELREIAFSAGSACASGSGRPSHVLTAIGLSDAEARSSIRLGFGRFTTDTQIDEAIASINAAARRQLEWA